MINNNEKENEPSEEEKTTFDGDHPDLWWDDPEFDLINNINDTNIMEKLQKIFDNKHWHL